ncbi:YiiX/YebB-like N1pC/P60 family cysteine hydrolase [Pantoea agglomerans]|uniref:YiiX/YebB-like N1pC/P60 family cysteine hydrolase n=1 Tax=Enterobacter agglomerans TaxID=549 RepID=UPI003209FCDF
MSVSGLNAGDVLLINSRTKRSWLNRTGQKWVRKGSSANSTHVALSLGDGGFIHADTTCGVDLVFLTDLLKNSEDDWKVIRHIELTDEVEEKIKKAAIFHFGKAYNYKFILKEDEKSLFCSQLVDVVFNSIGISIFSHEESNSLWNLNNAFPIDFDNLISDKKTWIDVKDIYLDKIHSGFLELLKTNFMMLQYHVHSERRLRNDYSALQELMNVMNETYNQLPNEVKDIEYQNLMAKEIKEFSAHEDSFFYNFWNSKIKK